jgi:hypothetical protein
VLSIHRMTLGGYLSFSSLHFLICRLRITIACCINKMILFHRKYLTHYLV